MKGVWLLIAALCLGLLLPLTVGASDEAPEASEVPYSEGQAPAGTTPPEAEPSEPEDPPEQSGLFDSELYALYEEQMELAGADELAGAVPEEAEEFIERFGLESLDPAAILSLDLRDLLGALWDEMGARLQAPLRLFCYILAVVLLCALLDTLSEGKEGALAGVFRVVAVLFLCAVLLQPMLDCIDRAAGLISSANTFLLTYIPIFSAVLLMAGQAASASAYHLILFAIVQGVSAVASSVLVPLLFCYLAFCLAASASGELQLTAIAAFIKKAVTWLLGIATTVLVGFLSIQSIVAAGADTVGAKAAKFVISSTVPVVGSALSDALLTVKGCVGLLRSSVGVFGILTVTATFLPMLLELIAWSLLLRLGALASSMFSAKTITSLLEGVAATISMLIAILCSYLLLITLSTTVLILLGGGTV